MRAKHGSTHFKSQHQGGRGWLRQTEIEAGLRLHGGTLSSPKKKKRRVLCVLQGESVFIISLTTTFGLFLIVICRKLQCLFNGISIWKTLV